MHIFTETAQLAELLFYVVAIVFVAGLAELVGLLICWLIVREEPEPAMPRNLCQDCGNDTFLWNWREELMECTQCGCDNDHALELACNLTSLDR